jgi:hypothetical protein
MKHNVAGFVSAVLPRPRMDSLLTVAEIAELDDAALDALAEKLAPRLRGLVPASRTGPQAARRIGAQRSRFQGASQRRSCTASSPETGKKTPFERGFQ